jgi:hypothetical protein
MGRYVRDDPNTRDVLITIPVAALERLEERARRNIRYPEQEAAAIVLGALARERKPALGVPA